MCVALKIAHSSLRPLQRLSRVVARPSRPFARESRRHAARSAGMDRLNELLGKNVEWAEAKLAEREDYFSRYAEGQWPELLMIGCSDSRVVLNDIIGMNPGDVFVHRNVGNVVSHADPNCMSVFEYGVGVLKVKHVIICGHYGCGAVKAALTLPAKTPGVVNCWLASLRDVYNKYADQINSSPSDKRANLFCELNAMEQTVHACTCPAVQAAWANGQELYVHCLVYDICCGKLKVLIPAISSLEQLTEMEELKIGSGHGVKNTFDSSIKGILELEKCCMNA